MKARNVLMMVGVLMAVAVQARHPTLTRIATPGDPTFDIVISYWSTPDGDNDGKTQDPENPSTQDKIERIIQHFADCVYESTEGVHRLRKVRIFMNNKNENKCDIQWIQYRDSLSPRNQVSTHRSTGNNGYIKFGDEYWPQYNYLLNQELGGYTLGHEWGHYAYSLYDEYMDGSRNTLNENLMVNPSLMSKGNYKAVGGNYQHLNFSVRHRGGNATDGFGPYENTRETRQHAVYGESCWETLTRGEPSFWKWSDFFRGSWFNSLDPRTYYPELAAKAPKADLPYPDNLPTIQLPEEQAAARAELDIIWMAEPAIQIVLDKSGSMGGDPLDDSGDATPLDNVIAAAQSLIDIIEDGMSVGIVTFGSTVSVVSPIVEVTNDVIRADLKTAIAGITAEGSTAIGDAMRDALNGLKSYGISNRAAGVFLLTDGISNVGVDPLSVVPVYQTEQVPVFGFGYGEEVDPQLPEITLSTGGSYFGSPVQYNALFFAFMEANAIFSDRTTILQGNSDPFVVAGIGIASTTEPVHVPFLVDSSMEQLRLSIAYSGTGAPSTALNLMRPDGTLLSVTPANAPDGSVLMDFRADNPVAGEWAIVGQRPSDTPISYLADAKTSGGYCLDWIALEQPEDSTEYLSVVSLRGEGSIDGAYVTGKIRFDNGETVSCVFSNFAAGLYGAMNIATHAGYGTMTVTASNPNGTAIMTWRDVEIDDFEGGDLEPPPDEPIAENFTRIISKRICVKTYLYVDANRSDDSGDGYTWDSAFKHLQTAIDMGIRTGVDIVVTNGIYEPIVTSNCFVTIRSVNGAEWTTIDGGGTNRCAMLGSAIMPATNTTLVGFTLANGSANSGGGSWYGTLTDCILSGNTATDSGGGAYGGTLNNCIFEGNAAKYGGGAYAGKLNNCVLSGNSVSYYGGGVDTCTLNNCTLEGNTATYGGGAYYSTIYNSVLTGNMADYGGGAYDSTLGNCMLTGNIAIDGGGANYSMLKNCTLSGNTATGSGGGAYWGWLDNCIVWGNTAAGAGGDHGNVTFRYSCTTPLPTGSYNGAGNIVADPLFLDATNGNFRLQPESPCINTGNSALAASLTDLDGNPRILGDRVDMGAYEWAGAAGYGEWLAYKALTDEPGNYARWLVDPDDPNAVFRTALRFEGGAPLITWQPDLGSVRAYTIEGRERLDSGTWQPVDPASVTAPMYFFRVKIAVP